MIDRMLTLACPECGNEWIDHQTCIDHFYMMGFWELDHQLWDVHHLMVLSYYLQHPSSLSQEWLIGAKQQLVDFIENGVSPQEMRNRIAPQVNSNNRDFKIRATPESAAHYPYPIVWSMTAKDIVNAGMDHYYVSVRQWATSILADLRQSKNLSSAT
jgi:hypothetical protein